MASVVDFNNNERLTNDAYQKVGDGEADQKQLGSFSYRRMQEKRNDDQQACAAANNQRNAVDDGEEDLLPLIKHGEHLVKRSRYASFTARVRLQMNLILRGALTDCRRFCQAAFCERV